MNYQTTATLAIAPDAETPWSFDLTLLPHPLFFAYWTGAHAYDPATETTVEGNFRNAQIAPAGTAVDSLVNSWMALAKRWRLCYQSVTILQDGPDLANQGTIAICQSTFEPRITYTGCGLGTEDATFDSLYPLAYWDELTEGPNFERSQAMPNAMIGRSRDGGYVPLKLTDTCQEWHSEKDFIIPVNKGTQGTGNISGFVQLQSTLTPAFPFPSVVPAHGTVGHYEGQRIPDLMNGNVAHISARNLSDQTSFTFQFRMGIEIQLDPSSTLTPQLKLSPPYDPTALDTYFAIARELKDGYPADYNVTGKLWNVIKDALKVIAPPLLTMIPGGQALVPLVEPTLTGLDSVGKAIKQKRQERREEAARLAAAAPKNTIELSQATVERAREQRPPNSARPVQQLPRRPRPMRRRPMSTRGYRVTSA